jgi:hypothetical protein
MEMNGRTRRQGHTLIRSNVVGLVALFVALSGTTYAAVGDSGGGEGIKATKAEEKKGKRGPAGPRGPQGPQGPQGPPGPSSTDALSLGGAPASAYQKGCSAGAVWGFASVDTRDAGPEFANVPGFNCTGGAVQLKREGPGDFTLRFVGSATSFAVVSCTRFSSCYVVNADGTGTPGEFDVLIFQQDGTITDNGKFQIVAV